MIRRILFWLHLNIAITAGSVILVMATTGVLLAFEPQLVDWAERDLGGGVVSLTSCYHNLLRQWADA